MPGRTDSNDQRVTALGNHGDYAVAWISADAQNNDKILVQVFSRRQPVERRYNFGTGYPIPHANHGTGQRRLYVDLAGLVQDEQRIFMQRFNADGSQAGSQNLWEKGPKHHPANHGAGSDGAFVLTRNGTDGTKC
jgi:hypothetical protein